MGERLVIRAVREQDIADLLLGLRQADRDECNALIGPGRADETLRKSIDNSAMVFTAEHRGRVMAIFGLVRVSLLGDRGLPWLLGTDLIDRHPGALIRDCRPYISRMLTICPQLVNVVDARNIKSIRFLKKMGFELLPAQPMGVAGLPFHPFVMSA